MKKSELNHIVKTQLLNQYHASLCSHIKQDTKRELSDFPYASLVRYSLNAEGQPVLLLSRIAEHSQYIADNNKVALLIQQDANELNGNVQECARITLIGELIAANTAQTQTFSERYFRQFPDAKMYFEQLDFDFYYLKVKQTRYVGGFAKAHWLAGQDWLPAINEFAQAEDAMISHMNSDHANAVQHYCQLYGLHNPQQDALLSGLFVEGMQLRIGFKTHFLAFDEPITSRDAMHKKLIELARKPSL